MSDAAIEVLASAQLFLDAARVPLRAPPPWLPAPASPRLRHGRKPHSSSFIATCDDKISAADRSFISCPSGIDTAGENWLVCGKTRTCVRPRSGAASAGSEFTGAAGASIEMVSGSG